MNKQGRHIVAVAIMIVPFYGVAILQKVLFTREEVLVEAYLGYYMLLGIAGIATVLLSNRYLLHNKTTVFREPDIQWLNELALAGMLLGFYYLIDSISRISWGIWWAPDADRMAVDALLAKIFDSTLFSLVIIGPFNWFNEGFLAMTVAFLLLNLWSLIPGKQGQWISIALVALLTALIQIDHGIPGMINSFCIMSVFGFMFLRYPTVLPLIIAAILHQTIDLASYWFYVA
jgi:hypothetical protein